MPGYSSFWGDGLTINNSYALLNNKSPIRNRVKRVMNRSQFRAFTELFDALIGAASGGTALATHKQVAAVAPFGNAGGARTIETITDINRVTTAADITALKEMTFNVTTRPATYPRDLSGNGGQAYT